jgi:CRISPR-associated endonuclease/helicase Cas3
MGGQGRPEEDWRTSPERPQILVGTIDMLLSRALSRGYGESRFAWPVSFGLLSNDAHWIFDEVQLLGPALATSRQLDAFRASIGTALPTSCTWMSATIAGDDLRTVDAPQVPSAARPTPEDARGRLGDRMHAPKRVIGLPAAKDAKAHLAAVAEAAVACHQPGTQTLVVVNTVERAQGVESQLARRADADVLLIHSRYRPADRRRLDAAVGEVVDGHSRGRIIVSTQVIEAGVDLSARALVTELAPWASIVQRAGRCNRFAEHEDAQITWLRPPSDPPYDQDQLEDAERRLQALEGTIATPASLSEQKPLPAATSWQVLRRRDLTALFDTAPDLSGNDLDVGRFIRDGDDLDALVAWRDPDAGGRQPLLDPPPHRDELCPVPVHALRKWIADRKADVWRIDVRASPSQRWRRIPRGDLATDIRPGVVLIMPSAAGGYDPVLGWSPSTRAPVAVIGVGATETQEPLDEGIADDPRSTGQRWVPLQHHLANVAAQAEGLFDTLDGGDLPPGAREAAVRAAALHDIGKAHPTFQRAVLDREDQGAREQRGAAGPWAKSGRGGRLMYEPRGFRHELAGALALLGDAAGAVEGLREPALCRYLVAAHHGRVRLSARALPDEGAGTCLGVTDGDRLPPVSLPTLDGLPPSARGDAAAPSSRARWRMDGCGPAPARPPRRRAIPARLP